MVTIKAVDVVNPIIVITGDYGSGKSYVNKLIRQYINSTVSANIYDFLTRKILFVLGIHPTQIGYCLINSDIIDRNLYLFNNKLNYLKDEISNNGIITEDNVIYLIKTAIGLDIDLPEETISVIVSRMKNLIKDSFNKSFNKSLLLGELYSLTIYIFDSLKYNCKKESFINYYLSTVFPTFEKIYEEYKYRIVYYAYTAEEVVWMNNNYSTNTFFIEMSHKLKSQLLLKTKQYDKVDEITTNERKEEVEKMKKLSQFVITNELEMRNKLISKIMSQITI